MTESNLIYIKEDLKNLDKMLSSLNFAYEQCKNIDKNSSISEEEFSKLDSLTSRFSRLSDIIIQKVLRTIDEIDLENNGTIRDRLNRAEKKELIASTDDFVEIRKLRNDIFHEYIPEEMPVLFERVYHYTPILEDCVKRIKKYCKEKYNI